MKRKIKFLVYPLAVIVMSLFAVGCSDDDTGPKYDIIHGDGVIDIDGNEYTTVIIGDQEWMAENLRARRYNNGDDIPTGLSDEDWEDTTDGTYAIYPHEGGSWDDGPIEGINSDAEMVAAYGKLYNWYAATDERGLCPTGWHVPSNSEWNQLIDYVVAQGYPNDDWDDSNGAGNALKSCRQVNSPLGGDCDTSEHPRWNSHGTHYGFDAFGFSALPGGFRLRAPSIDFHNVGEGGYWWSANSSSGMNAYRYHIRYDGGKLNRGIRAKIGGDSIRCIRTADN